MAVFEKRLTGKINLDDTHCLTCTILGCQNVQGHVEFLMQVIRTIVEGSKWNISRRYSDFLALKNAVLVLGVELPLPPKKMFGNMEREFLAERQQGLQNFVNVVLNHPALCQSIHVKRFFDPENYSENYIELGLQFVSMFLRSEPLWELVEPLPEIGWRIRKSYYLLKPKSEPKQRLLCSWAALGPDCYLSDNDLQSYMKSLSTLQHPCICPVTFATAMDSGGITVRNYFSTSGSIRDTLLKVKPDVPFLKKYSKAKMYPNVHEPVLKACGRQILDALKFLHVKGVPCGHLHTGNLVIQNQICQLMDIESQILGLPSMYRPFITQFRKLQSLESVDVYSFGHILYEMSFGVPLQTATCDNFPVNCPSDLRGVLELLLSSEACKNGMPTVDDLIQNPFFADVKYPRSMKPKWKISSSLKVALQKSKELSEARLKEEQKMFKQTKRMSKIQKQLMSEDEKNRRKRISKQMSENAKSSDQKSQQNGNVTNNSASTSPSSSVDKNCSIPAPPPPPSVGPPPPPPPGNQSVSAPPPPPASIAKPSNDRKALLGSIAGFKKGGLKKAVTCDRSAPKV